MNRLLLKPLAILTICIAFAWLLCAQRCLAEKSDVHISKLERVLFEKINEDRKSENLPALALDKTLCKIARAHADDMLKNDFFGHTGSDGRHTQQRARQAGLRVPVYENIGWRSGPDPKPEMVLEIQKSFMNEPKDQPNHRYIMMLDKLKFVGVGVSQKNDQVAIVQVFTDGDPTETTSPGH